MDTTILPSNDHLVILSARIDATQQEVRDIREKCAALDKTIAAQITRIGSRPRESMDELKKETERIERLHVSTPQSNADERKFMVDIEKLRQKRRYLTEHQEAQREIDAFKAQRTELQQQLREKMKIMDELYSGCRKHKAATKSGAKTSDMVEDSINIPEDKMAHVIGRGGSSLRQLESEYSVHIDTDRQSTSLRLTGTAEDVERARVAIASIASIRTDEFPVSQDKIACLSMDAAELVQELQRQYDVRIDVSRAKKVCKLVGLAENIAIAKAAIQKIPSSAVTVAIEPAFLPFILGKNGATIRQIGEESHVMIDIMREANSLEILGRQENVARAAVILQELIDTNREIEETLTLDRRAMLGCILGPGGLKIRNLQKDLHVFLHTDKPNLGATTGGGASDAVQSKFAVLRIRGTRANVANAKRELEELMQEYDSNTEAITVPEGCLASIVGKQGSSIKKMREDYPDVQVDIEGSLVCIHSDCDASRQAVRLIIEKIVDANFAASMHLDADAMIVLKSTKGQALRSLLVDTLDLNVDMNAEESTVRLRGRRDAVNQGQRALESFQEGNVCAILCCTEDDCNALTHGGAENALKKSVEQRFGVEIYVSRKESLVRIRGPRQAIETAKAFIQGAFRGDSNHDSLVIPANPSLFSSLIGKGGSNMKKWETEHPGVRIDLLKDRGLIRILGPQEPAAVVQKMLLEYMESIKVVSKLSLDVAATRSSSGVNVDSVISAAAAMFQIQIEKTDDINVFVLKGTFTLVEEAKTYIVEAVGGKATRTIFVSLSHMSALMAAANSQSNGLFKSAQNEFGVEIGLDERSMQVTIRGATEATYEAKIRVVSLLEAMFPCEFVSIAMSNSCIKQLCAQRNLAEINLGVNVYADRPYSCVRIFGGPVEVNNAAKCLRQMMLDWYEKHAEFPYEEQMLSALLGKGGANISSLQEQLRVSMDINRQSRMIEIQAVSKQDLIKATQHMVAYLDKLRGEYWETTVDGKNMGLLLGKKGANIAKLREETGAKIDVNVNTNAVKVSGTAECVKIATEKIQSILQITRNQTAESMSIPQSAYPALLGPKGSTAQEIQDCSGARLDLDRFNGIATIKGSEEACRKAIELINQLLLDAGFDAILSATEASVPPPNLREESGERDAAELIHMVRTPPVMPLQSSVSNYSSSSMSKSSLRRRRRKMLGKAEEGEEVVDACDDPVHLPASPESLPYQCVTTHSGESGGDFKSLKLAGPPGLAKASPVPLAVQAPLPAATQRVNGHENNHVSSTAREAYFKSKSGFAVRM